MELEQKFQEKLIEIHSDHTVAIAVSGGVDSMVLMHLISKVQTHKVVVLTVNHGFRAEAVDEVNFVKQQAEIRNLECHILSNRVCSVHNKSQEVARDIRYSLMEKWCVEHSVEFVCTAHTKNDQAETVLLRLERGSGIDGLSGMRIKSAYGGVIIFRPMLEFSRVEILEYAINKKLVWVEDPSNANPKYRRTFYRNLIKESHNPSLIVERVCRTAEHMQRALSCILHYVKASLATCVKFEDLGYVSIRYNEFKKLHSEIAARILLLLLMAVGNRAVKPRYEKFYSAFSKVWNSDIHKPFTIHGCKIARSGEDKDILVMREVADICPVTPVGRVPCTLVWDGRFLLNIKDIGSNFNCNVDPQEESGVIDINGDERWSKAHIAPLGDKKIPEDFAQFHVDIARGLPVLVVGDKILACSLQNHNMSSATVVCVEKVLVEDRVDSLIFNQLDQ